MIGLLALLLGAYVIVILVLAMVCAKYAWNPPRCAAGWALAHGEPSTPMERNIQFQEWTLDRPDGARLCVWDVPGHDPNAPCLVLLHGWSRSKLTWLVRLEWWQARSSRILIPDLRGHGDSTPDGSTMGDIDADDIEVLVERCDESCVVLVGRSLGSVIAIHAAQRMARTLPGVVKGVIAVAPYQALSKTIRARLDQRRLPTFLVIPLTMAILRMRGVGSQPTTVAAAGISAPLLVIHGAKDPISAIEDARLIVAAANGELVEVREAGHGNHWDLEGERLDKIVESFLKKSIVDAGSGPKHQISPPAS